jgi:predicted PurR-regulated permease PerM
MAPETIDTVRPNPLTPERVIRWVLLTLAVAGVLFLLWYFVRLVIYLGVGVLLAYLLRPVKDWIQSFGFARIPAILLTFVAFLSLTTLLLTYLVPFAASQISAVTGELSPSSVAETISEQISSWLPINPASIREGIESSFDTLLQEDRLTEFAGSVFDVFTNIFYAIVIVPFVAFFFLKDGHRIRTGVLGLVPNRFFEIALGIVEKVESTIGRYFRALIIQSISIATIATIALSFAGVQYGLAVGIFVGFANTIPYFGPVIGLLAGSIVAISQTGDFALVPAVLIAMGVTQLTDNLLLQPLIFSRAARSHPLIILFVVLIGAQVAGIIGMLIAIPLATTLKVIMKEVLWSARHYRILRAL